MDPTLFSTASKWAKHEVLAIMLKKGERGPMKAISVMGIDLAKNVFHVYAEDRNRKGVVRKRFSRSQIIRFVANTSKCLIGVEACGGANFWVREFKKFGHTVRMIPPQYVKPFVKTNKNDFNDAQAICEAVQRPSMHFVSEKSIEQQDIQILHRVRNRLVRNRIGVCNEIRGFLAEYGIVSGSGVSKLRKKVQEILSTDEGQFTGRAKTVIGELYGEWIQMEERIERLNEQIKGVFEGDESCQRISKIPGVGPITATAIVAAVGNPSVFKNGRQMAAWLGLVPRQSSSGGKSTLLGISKRGDNYCRMLLVHGGRSVVKYAPNKLDKQSLWVSEKRRTRGYNKAAVAVANKNARIIWRMLMTGESYRPAA